MMVDVFVFDGLWIGGDRNMMLSVPNTVFKTLDVEILQFISLRRISLSMMLG